MQVQKGHELSDASRTERLERFLQSGQLSDVTVVCRGHTWKLHKINLATGSDFFRAAICDGFAEAADSSINLPEDDPAIIARLIRHIYLQEYPDAPCSQLKLQDSSFANHELLTVFDKADLATELFSAGVKLGVKELREQACRALRDMFWQLELDESPWNDARFTEVLVKAYTTTPPDVRALRDTLLEQLLYMLRAMAPLESPTLVQAMREHHDLAFDVATCHISDGWCCKQCGDESYTLLRPCECGLVRELCDKDECMKERVEATICWSCHEKGTLAPSGY